MAILIARLNQTWGGQVINNMLGYQMAVPTPANLDLISNHLMQEWFTRLGGALDDSYTFENITWYDADAAPGTPPIHIGGIGQTFVGGSAGHGLPKQSAILVSHSCVGGPPHRGRSYLAGFTENENASSGTVETATVTAVNGLFAALRNYVTGTFGVGSFLAVVRRPTLTEPALAAEIVTSNTSSFWATQRSRSAFS